MTTKDQERQAIEKIRKIVEGLGENSYVGFAMDGSPGTGRGQHSRRYCVQHEGKCRDRVGESRPKQRKQRLKN